MFVFILLFKISLLDLEVVNLNLKIMKSIRFILVYFIALILLGCQSNGKWEYKVLPVYSDINPKVEIASLSYSTVTPNDSTLNVLGLEGWELVSSYLEMETTHPNFGDSKYVTGLQPNVRPQRAVLIFKRHLK